MKEFKKSLFIFRRDLRLEDNIGLLALLEKSEEVIPAFIFDPRQIDREENEYFSEPAFAFLLESLRELDADLKARGSQLYIFDGLPHELVTSLIADDEVDAVCVNKDYTPFARNRDKEIADVCETRNVVFERHDDAVLSPIETIRTGQGKLYTVFTPFMKNAAQYEVPTPQKNNFSNYFSAATTTPTAAFTNYQAHTEGMELRLTGGRTEALHILKENSYLNGYKDDRNLPAKLTPRYMEALTVRGYPIHIKQLKHTFSSFLKTASHYLAITRMLSPSVGFVYFIPPSLPS